MFLVDQNIFLALAVSVNVFTGRRKTFTVKATLDVFIVKGVEVVASNVTEI